MKTNEINTIAIEASLAFARLTRDVAHKLEEQFGNQVPSTIIVLAQSEAEEIAESTEVPHLILPILAEEKVRQLSKRFANDPFLTPLAA